MPITFEQPDPMGYSALAGVPGQVAQGNLDRQYLQQQLALGLQAGHASGGGGGAGGVGAHNAQMATQAALANQQLSPSMAQQYAESQQAQQQNAMMQHQSQMQQDQFSFADGLQLQKLQAGKSQLQSMFNSGEIGQEQLDEGLSQLHGVMGPLTLKQQTTKQQMM